MKNVYFFLLFVVFSVLLISCNSDQEILDSPDGQTEKMTDKYTIKFIYYDQFYSSSYAVLNDSTVVLNDEMADLVYQKLMDIEDLSVYVHSDGVMECFDNAESLKAVLSGREDSPVWTKSNYPTNPRSFTGGTLYLYEDLGFTGKSAYASFGLEGVNMTNMEGNLENRPGPWSPRYNIGNDVLTSLKVSANYVVNSSSVLRQKCVVVLYEDVNYRGKSLWFSFNPYETFEIRTLRDHKLKGGGLFSSSKSWNDQVSSIKVYFE